MSDILFVVKDKSTNTNKKQVSGLIAAADQNSAYLNSVGIQSNSITIPDANFLDAQIKQHHPQIVIIEGVWINPEKFKTLVAANPFVKEYVIRIHSDMAYLAIEGQALSWAFKSQKMSPKIKVAANCYNLYNGINPGIPNKFIYLPNMFNEGFTRSRKEQDYNVLNVACLGAVRLLKNHAVQVLASIKAAEEMGKKLKFHMNDLTNDAGHSVLGNIRQIFGEIGKHELIIDTWKSGQEYKNAIKQMDMGLQISFTESFNIVAANFICNGVPIVVGETITWLPEEYKTSYTDIDRISNKIKEVYAYRNNLAIQTKAYKLLQDFNNQAKNVWDEYMSEKLKR